MIGVWPEEEEGVQRDFDRAHDEPNPPFALVVPWEVEQQGPAAYYEWIAEHHPGVPVVVATEKAKSTEAWLARIAWLKGHPQSEPGEWARRWMAAYKAQRR